MRLLLASLAAAVLAAAPAPAADDPGAAAFAEKVTVEIKDQPLRSALDEFFAGSGLSYTLGLEVPNVPIRLSLRDLRRETALALIVRIARAAFPGLYYTREGANVVIWVDPTRPEAPLAEMKPDPRLEKRLALVSVKEMPLRKAVEALTRLTGVQVVVLPNLADVPVTLDLKDRPAGEAFREVTRQSGSIYPATLTTVLEPEGEVYVLGVRKRP